MTVDPTARPTPSRPAHAGVEAERVDEGYLERRRLRTGTAGWLLLAGLGVSAVMGGLPRSARRRRGGPASSCVPARVNGPRQAQHAVHRTAPRSRRTLRHTGYCSAGRHRIGRDTEDGQQ